MAEEQAELLAPCASRVVENGQEILRVGSTMGSGVQFPSARTPGVSRIAIVGESSGELLGRALDDLSRDGNGGRHFEVVNCARAAADLEVSARLFDEVLRYAPDAVVVVFGHNIRYQYQLGALRLHAQRLVGASCLLTALASVSPAGDDALKTMPIASRLAGFEEVLRRTAEETRSRGVRLVVSTMAANLWLPPRANNIWHDEAVGNAMRLDAEGRVDEALEGLSPPGGEPGVRSFLTGVLHARAGRSEPAREALRRALDEDPAAYRAPTAVNALIRQIAAETGALLRDTERAVEAKAPGGLPGWESFVDNCHLIPDVIRDEAVAILGLVGADAIAADDSDNPEIPAATAYSVEFPLERTISGVFESWSGGSTSPFSQGLAYAVGQWLAIDEGRTNDAVRRAIQRAENQEPGRLDVLLPIADALAHAGRMSDALRVNDRARQRDPSSSHAWRQAALFALRSGDSGAAHAYATRAIGLDPRDRAADSILRATANGAPQ